MAKKKVERSAKDKALMWCGVLAGALALLTAIPMVPWRYAKADGHMGARFSGDRKYSLLSVGNNFQQYVSWSTMKTGMCRFNTEISSANPLNAIGSIVGSTLTGGALTGCGSWPACKNAVAQRCSSYTTMMVAGIFSELFMLGGGVCGCLVPVMMMQEDGIKKKKKKLEAQTTTMYVSIGAFVAMFLGTTIYVGASSSVFSSFRNGSYYPYPDAHIGLVMAWMAVFLAFPVIYLGVTRIYPIFGSGGEEDEEEGIDDYMYQDPMAMGGVPGYDYAPEEGQQ